LARRPNCIVQPAPGERSCSTESRRAFTILELLIVLAILLALALLSLPFSSRILDERSADSAKDQLHNLMILSRSTAQLEGAVIEVRSRAGGASVEAHHLRVTRDDAGAPVVELIPIREGWARVVLPNGWALRRSRGQSPEDGVAPDSEPLVEDAAALGMPGDEREGDAADPGSSWALVRFLPDGGIGFAQGGWLTDGRERVWRCAVDPLAGTLSFAEERVRTDDESDEWTEAEGLGGDDPMGRGESS